MSESLQILGAVLLLLGLSLALTPWLLVAVGVVLLVGPEVREGVRRR